MHKTINAYKSPFFTCSSSVSLTLEWRKCYVFLKNPCISCSSCPCSVLSTVNHFFVLFWRCPTTCVTLLKHFKETYQNPLSVNANSRNNKQSKKYCEKLLPLRRERLWPQWVCGEDKEWLRITCNQWVVWSSFPPVWHSFLPLSESTCPNISTFQYFLCCCSK